MTRPTCTASSAARSTASSSPSPGASRSTCRHPGLRPGSAEPGRRGRPRRSPGPRHAAEGRRGGGAAPTAWIDTIPVIHFVHTVENGVERRTVRDRPADARARSGAGPGTSSTRIRITGVRAGTDVPARRVDPTDGNPARLRLVVARDALDPPSRPGCPRRVRATRPGAAVLGAVEGPAAADRARRLAG